MTRVTQQQGKTGFFLFLFCVSLLTTLSLLSLHQFSECVELQVLESALPHCVACKALIPHWGRCSSVSAWHFSQPRHLCRPLLAGSACLEALAPALLGRLSFTNPSLIICCLLTFLHEESSPAAGGLFSSTPEQQLNHLGYLSLSPHSKRGRAASTTQMKTCRHICKCMDNIQEASTTIQDQFVSVISGLSSAFRCVVLSLALRPPPHLRRTTQKTRTGFRLSGLAPPKRLTVLSYCSFCTFPCLRHFLTRVCSGLHTIHMTAPLQNTRAGGSMHITLPAQVHFNTSSLPQARAQQDLSTITRSLPQPPLSPRDRSGAWTRHITLPAQVHFTPTWFRSRDNMSQHSGQSREKHRHSRISQQPSVVTVRPVQSHSSVQPVCSAVEGRCTGRSQSEQANRDAVPGLDGSRGNLPARRRSLPRGLEGEIGVYLPKGGSVPNPGKPKKNPKKTQKTQKKPKKVSHRVFWGFPGSRKKSLQGSTGLPQSLAPNTPTF